MFFSFGPSKTPIYERRRKMLGNWDARKTLTPPPPVVGKLLVTQAGTGFTLVTQSGNRLTTQS